MDSLLHSVKSGHPRIENWLKAVEQRHARRMFYKRGLHPDHVVALEAASRERLFPDARTVLIQNPIETVSKGMVGSLGKPAGAPVYAAVIGDMESPHVQEHAGIQGETVVLEAVSLGVSSCWIGGLFYPELVARTCRWPPMNKFLR